MPDAGVALLAEGVDRNVSIAAVVLDDWLVALLAEGVDRNKNVDELRNGCPVALLAEGVDRNSKGEGWHCMTAACRPPRGGRG